MEDLLIHKDPQDTFPTMIVAFAGWPDASEAATRALKYLVRKLGAKKFGEIDSEGFYDFTMVRPQTRINSDGERIITWPQNDFYFYKNDDINYDYIWFIEEDVFIPNINTIQNINNKYESGDLLSAKNDKSYKYNMKRWHWRHKPWIFKYTILIMLTILI